MYYIFVFKNTLFILFCASLPILENSFLVTIIKFLRLPFICPSVRVLTMVNVLECRNFYLLLMAIELSILKIKSVAFIVHLQG